MGRLVGSPALLGCSAGRLVGSPASLGCSADKLVGYPASLGRSVVFVRRAGRSAWWAVTGRPESRLEGG
jgi:hypothetical protein